MKNQIRLCNFIFLPWMFWYLPLTFNLLAFWRGRIAVLVVLLGNFAIDSLVACLAMRRQGLEGKRLLWKKSIWRIWGIGLLCDIAGTGLIVGLYSLLNNVLLVPWDFASFPGTTLIALPGVLLAGVLIYFLNRRFAFTKCGLDPARIHRLSLALAVFTAPYTMMIPLYG